jgi:hypothetical protein
MKVLKAQVRNGRLVLDEPTDLPEGTEVEVALVGEEALPPEERARPSQAIEEGAADLERGDDVYGLEFIARLRDGHAPSDR